MTEKHSNILKDAVLLYNNIQQGKFQHLKDFFEKEYSKIFNIPNTLIDELYNLSGIAPDKYLKQFDWINYIVTNKIFITYGNNHTQKYVLEVSIDEMKIISYCLDLYMRMLMGQFRELSYLLSKSDTYQSMQKPLLELRQVFFPELTCGLDGNYGITSDEISENAHIGYEMYKIIRKVIWIADGCNPSYSVDSREPLRLSDEPFIKIIKAENK